MKLAILSDTHENELLIEKAVNKIKEENIDIVLHCGDLISPPLLDYFKDFKDFKLVFGNNDGNQEKLKLKCKEFGFEEPNFIREFEINDKKFFMGHEPFRVQDAISSEKYDYVLHGHTHVQKDEMVGKTRIINPGALFMVPYYTFAVLDVDTDQLDFYEV